MAIILPRTIKGVKAHLNTALGVFFHAKNQPEHKRDIFTKAKICNSTLRNFTTFYTATINYQTRKGVQKTPLPGFSAYGE